MKISVIIPTYNEAGNIGKLVSEIKSNLKLVNHEIIIVDDNSPDSTLDIVTEKNRKYSKIIKILNKKRIGLAKSVLKGINFSTGEVIIGMDADFNHDPKILPKLLEKIKTYDFVIASRFVQGGKMAEYGRFWTSLLFNLILKYIFGFAILDNTSGFYAIRKKSLNKLKPKRIYRGYGEYELRLSWYAKVYNLKTIEIPAVYKKRLYGKSKSKLIKMFFNYLIEAWKLSRGLEK